MAGLVPAIPIVRGAARLSASGWPGQARDDVSGGMKIQSVIPGRRWRSHRRGRESPRTLGAMGPLPSFGSPGMTRDLPSPCGIRAGLSIGKAPVHLLLQRVPLQHLIRYRPSLTPTLSPNGGRGADRVISTKKAPAMPGP